MLTEAGERAARPELWPKLVAVSPSVSEFQAKTTRQIPLFMVTREDPLHRSATASVPRPTPLRLPLRANGSRLADHIEASASDEQRKPGATALLLAASEQR